MFRLAFLRPMFDEASAAGAAVAGPVDATEETVDDIIERLETTVSKLGTTVETLAGHMAKIVELGVSLKPAEAIGEAAAGVKDAAQDAGATVGTAVEGAGSVAATPVAALEDAANVTAKTVEQAPKEVHNVFRRKLKKH